MAIYHCSTKHVSRSSGRSAVASAAYRSGEELVNHQDGLVHDFSRKEGIAHTEIVLPDGVSADWALERSKLWNAAEVAEKRKDARVAREFIVALPHELNAEQRTELTQAFAHDLANRYGVAVDVAIHEPHRTGDGRNHHAHLLLTTREVSADGLGAKSQIEWRDKKLLAAGLPTGSMQIRDIRVAWENHANEHLGRAGHEVRVDHRSHSDRGLEIEPTQHVGVHATQMERRGEGVSRSRHEEGAAERNAEIIREKPEQALAIITGEKSVFDRHDVARTLHRYIDDPESFQSAFARVMQSPELVELRSEVTDARGNVEQLARYTTRDMLAVETRMIDSAQKMAQEGGTGVSDRHVAAALNARPFLADEQRQAVRYVTDEGRIAVVMGFAGTGKSTMLGAAREAWEAEGYRVHGAALSGKAAEGLQESSGIESRTLASWEYGWDRGRDQLGPGDVFVIDEAGMVSSRQLSRFITEADQVGAKVVLVGDTEQLQPINAGAAFRAVSERIGYIELADIRRQSEPWQREASVNFARQRTGEGLAAYQEHGAVHFEATKEDARAQIVQEYVSDTVSNPDASRLVLTHLRADVRDLNSEIRASLQERGSLQGEVTYETNAGERNFAEGDRIIFLENDRDLDVKNGMLGTVEKAEAGKITARLDNDRSVTFNTQAYTAFDHGYAATIHKSQGATADRAYVLASPSMDRHLTYVAMTRHREGAQLYAGRDEFKDFKALSSQLSEGRTKETTLDYLDRGDRGERSETPAAKPEKADVRERLAALHNSREGSQGRSEQAKDKSDVGQRMAAMERSGEAQERIARNERLRGDLERER